MIKVVIVDDEPENRSQNKQLLTRNFPNIDVVAEAGSVDSAVEKIKKHRPHLVLMDIEIIGGTGFNILQQLKPYNFKVIFITAFNDFALKAIKFSAMDYLVKPIDEYEFIQAIEKALSQIESDDNFNKQNEYLLDFFKKQNQLGNIILRTSEAIHLVEISEIVYCKSDNAYTSFFLTSGEVIIVSKNLKEYSQMLNDYGFLRPHQSYLVNLKYIKKVDKSDGGFVVLKNGKEIPVSVRQKKKLIEIFEKL
jgi:two-component system LytT family response regulator